MVANGTSKPSIEVGIIGREGMTGLAVVLGNDRALHETYIQVAGKGLSAATFRAMGKASLHAAQHAPFTVQRPNPLANGRHKIEERLARWLLMANDRIDGKEVPLTHEFLGLMPGTHRPGVTIALQALERAGLIPTKRRSITILDRKRLEKGANGAYVRPNDE